MLTAHGYVRADAAEHKSAMAQDDATEEEEEEADCHRQVGRGGDLKGDREVERNRWKEMER